MANSRVADFRRFAGLAAFVIAAAVFTCLAGLMMFSRFMLYDDEGYVLTSVRNFAEHGRLYGEVYTQYGPLPYVFYYVLHLLGMPLTHTAGRLVTIAAWSGTAVLSATIVWRIARSYTLMIAVLAAVFVYLWIMVSEPTHPGGIIALVVVLIASFGAHWLVSERMRAWALLTGIGIAALLLTKINVGGFATISAGAFILLNHKSVMIRRYAPWIVIAGFALLPFVLMRPLLGAGWVQTYAGIFAVSAATTLGAASFAATPCVGWCDVRSILLGAIAVCLTVSGVVLARGTSLPELLHGVLLAPMKHPVSFSLRFPWPLGSEPATVIATGFFLVLVFLRRSDRRDVADFVIVALRLIAVLALTAVILRFPGSSPDHLVFSFGLPWIWIFVWPLNHDTPGMRGAGMWIGLLLLGQFLHPFPVPGSQIAWGTFLIIPLTVLGTVEALNRLVRYAGISPAAPLRIGRAAAALGSLAFAGMVGQRLSTVARQYLEGRPLGLSGAENIRLPDNATALYRTLAFNALAHADILFSLPGMFSLNLWTNLPTPTLANVTHWFSLLDDAQQQQIIRVLEAHPRAAVVVQTKHVDFLRERHLAPSGPLYDYIEQSFEPAFSLDDFQFRVRRGRRVAPFFTAELFQRQESDNREAVADPENTRLVMSLSLPMDQAIGSIEIISPNGRAEPFVLRNDNVRVEVTPITLHGEPRGPTETRGLPLIMSGPTAVALYFDGRKHSIDPAETLIVLRNVTGGELGLVRMRL